MEVPPIVLLGLQVLTGFVTVLIMFLISRVFAKLDDHADKLDENTKSTLTLAKASAVTDTKVDTLMIGMAEVRNRVNRMAEQVTILETKDGMPRKRRVAN